MASTYAPNTAFLVAKEYIKSMPIERISSRVLDEVCSMIWMAAPWRWTLGSLPIVTLAANTQDYSIALPSDFLFVTEAYIASGSDIPRKLNVEPALPANVTIIGFPTKVTVFGTPGGAGTLRVMPKPPSVTAGQQVVCLYKKQAPKISDANAGTPGALQLDDEWFYVYQAGVLALAYQYADDPRAGSAQVDSSGRIVWNGQWGIFQAHLAQMRERERLQSVETPTKPEVKGDRS